MRIKLTRYIPEGYKEFKPELGDYPKDMFACYVNLEQPHNPRAIFFTGKQTKSTWHYRFADIPQMKKQINETISRLMSWEEMKAKRKEERKNAVLDINVGDIFSYSWGYDQTNVDFYQVTDVKGKTFKIKSIGKKYCGEAPSGSMSDYVIAVKNSFIEDEHHPELTKRGLSMDFGCLSKTDDKEKHFQSWYA